MTLALFVFSPISYILSRFTFKALKEYFLRTLFSYEKASQVVNGTPYAVAFDMQLFSSASQPSAIVYYF